MHRLLGISCLAGAVLLSACATTEEVERAQATANQALSAASAAQGAAQAADQKADLAGQRAAQAAQMAQNASQAAMQAQATASAAQGAAAVAHAKGLELDNRFAQARQNLEQRLSQGRTGRSAPRVARGERE